MDQNWFPRETNTHQDHVIAHVLGATVLGHFTADESAYLLLDIGFVWIIYLDGEMGLVPQSMAIAELDVDEETKAQLRRDIRHLENGDVESGHLEQFTNGPAGCLIVEVDFLAADDHRRILIKGEDATLMVEMSLTSRVIRFRYD